MLKYCRYHNKLQDYAPYFDQWTDEQMCNYALTLCHMTDKMMMSFLKKLEQEFITQGGIKERMHRARTGFRNKQDERLKQLETDLPAIKHCSKPNLKQKHGKRLTTTSNSAPWLPTIGKPMK